MEKTWLQGKSGSQIQQLELFAAELRKVNQSLWDLENNIRHLRSLSREQRSRRIAEVVSIALAIPELNDERARIVAGINSLFDLVAEEKLYRGGL
jgi:cell division protein ZapA (FtsZ GTPase activity inhibitor)